MGTPLDVSLLRHIWFKWSNWIKRNPNGRKKKFVRDYIQPLICCSLVISSRRMCVKTQQFNLFLEEIITTLMDISIDSCFNSAFIDKQPVKIPQSSLLVSALISLGNILSCCSMWRNHLFSLSIKYYKWKPPCTLLFFLYFHVSWEYMWGRSKCDTVLPA